MTSDGPHAERITRLLESARSALRAGQPKTALELLETVTQLAPDNGEVHKLKDEAHSLMDGDDLGGAASDSSVAWNVQYAAGADESIDEPPPLAMDLFDMDSQSIDESFISGSEDRLSSVVTMDERTSGGAINPDQDPFTMPQNVFSEMARRPSTSLPGTESATSKVKTLKSVPHVTREALLAQEEDVPKLPPASASGEPMSTLSDKEGFKALTNISSPVCLIDTLDEEVDEDLVEGVEDWLQLAVRRHDAGDFVASLELVERILEEAPQHAVAHRLREENENQIRAAEKSRLGAMNHCPRVRLRQQEVVWQSLNHHEGFIISLVDGHTSYETIIEISAMGEQQTIKILARLVELGVIG